MAEEKTETTEISPTYEASPLTSLEASLVSLETAELTKKKEVKRLYGWFMGRVLKNEKSRQISMRFISSLDKDILSTSSETKHLDHAVYISKNILFTSSIFHDAFLVCPDGEILYASYGVKGDEFIRMLEGEKFNYIERDLSIFKLADIKTIEKLINGIRKGILPEMSATSKK